jgi:hypothetical protein
VTIGWFDKLVGASGEGKRMPSEMPKETEEEKKKRLKKKTPQQEEQEGIDEDISKLRGIYKNMRNKTKEMEE